MDGLVSTYIERTEHLPFQWGVCDCATWVADFVKYTTTIDPMHDFRGTYKCARSYLRLVQDHGGLGHIVEDEMHGFSDYNGVQGVGIARQKGREICVLLSGDFMIAKTDGGVYSIRHRNSVRGWTI